MLDWILNRLRQPEELFSLDELHGRGSPAPRTGGVYAWYFRSRPLGVPAGSHSFRAMDLLYVGIAPSTAQSRRTLRQRISEHIRDDASRSTLRRSLGSALGFPQHPMRSSLWFAAKEGDLSAWLRDNAMVCWVEYAEPWAVEAAVIGEIRPPLNLDHNRNGAPSNDPCSACDAATPWMHSGTGSNLTVCHAALV